MKHIIKEVNFEQPDFLLCEIPVKTNSFNDHRLWVFCKKSLSLIEFIYLNDMIDFEIVNAKYYFTHTTPDQEDEFYLAVYTQNNCAVAGINEKENVNKAWEFLDNYLTWDDNLIFDDAN